MEEGQKEPVSFPSDDSQSTSQEEIREGEQKNESLNMILDAWKDSFTFEDRRYSSSQQSLHDTIFVCSITTKIVGLGAIEFNDHELLELVRYPQSPYDKSAIKVFNSSSVEVGYLHIPVAKVLSPLVDLQKINLEGEVTNSRNRYDSSMPCLVKIFSKSDDTQNVQDWILQNSLCFCDQPGPSFRAYEGLGVQEKNMIEKLGTLEPPKNVIKAKLLDHQKEGLWWLVRKEKSDELPPFWEVKDGSYLNLLTMHQTDRRPDPLHGGIFADDHGLGKTLTFLSLISFDKVGTLPEATGKRDTVMSVSSGKKRGGLVRGKGTGGQKTHTLLGNNTKESSLDMADDSSSALVPKQTLIVCPSVVCSTWESQLQEHTHKGSLKLYKYYGNSRTKDVEELKKYDIVLTTYRTLTAECFRRMRCPLMKIEWWRVILDEAHVIKNANARQSRAVTQFTARRRWAVTGTHIQNGLFDLFSLMAFLQLDPLSIKRYWQGLLQRPLADGDENLLQVISCC
ncbi:putative SWI/SNF-related matrix-associated actin-dependent regulator of chromatin subfamily A member 3-like 1 [Populus alba]|uniref:putative SWI/SNF-related matrix-associated actin-dependent regulator of chromatin subfamily A member 3-like 1 n=1 Tax=Populus alba TaxID=43335 RepID=UPI003CC73DEC